MYYIPDIKDIVQISKVQFKLTDDKEKIILPELHIMFYKYQSPDKKDGFSGVCLELEIFSWDYDLKESQNILIELCKDYISTIIFKKNNLRQLFDDIKSKDMEDFWILYRQIKYEYNENLNYDIESICFKNL